MITEARRAAMRQVIMNVQSKNRGATHDPKTTRILMEESRGVETAVSHLVTFSLREP